MPLFTGGRIHAEVVKADLELKKFAEQRFELRSQIALEVKTALVNLDSARHEVEVAELGVKLAREEVSQARDRFRAGTLAGVNLSDEWRTRLSRRTRVEELAALLEGLPAPA